MKFTRQYSKRTKKFHHMKDQLAESLVEQKKKMRKMKFQNYRLTLKLSQL